MSILDGMEWTQSIPPETLTQDEQRSHLATAAYQVAEMWSNAVLGNLTTRERVHGAVYGLLDVLENGKLGVPAFQLTPILDDGSSITTVYRNGEQVEGDWDPTVAMPLTGNNRQAAEDPNHQPFTSVTDIYQAIYDDHRVRRSIAARDLFGD